jgi:hypothetical protein
MPSIEVWGELMDVGTRLRLLITFEEERPNENPSVKIQKLYYYRTPSPHAADGKYTVQFPFFGGKEEWAVRFEGGKMWGR